jgi:hypothetical protein
MRPRLALSLGLLLLGHASLQGQTRLATGTKLLQPVVAATVTIPALSLSGTLGGVAVNLGYSHINLSAGGYLDLMGPTSVTLGSSATVSGDGAVTNGSYAVRFDFVNVAAASTLVYRGPTGATMGTCNLNAWPGYNNLQPCSLPLSIADGRLLVSIEPTAGTSMTLKQVSVTRYQ